MQLFISLLGPDYGNIRILAILILSGTTPLKKNLVLVREKE